MQEVIKKLKENNQEHLLKYKNELTQDELNSLLNQIKITDFSYLEDFKEFKRSQNCVYKKVKDY